MQLEAKILLTSDDRPKKISQALRWEECPANSERNGLTEMVIVYATMFEVIFSREN